MQAWIGLGGNLEGSGQALDEALHRLGRNPRVSVERVSAYYHSAPWGKEDQAEFINAVAELEALCSPRELLDLLLETEAALGRQRGGERWGPRLVDLDLLSYQDCCMQSETLELPHPRMHLRAFVLVPLLELEPEFLVPGVGPAKECLARLPAKETSSVRPVDGPEEQRP